MNKISTPKKNAFTVKTTKKNEVTSEEAFSFEPSNIIINAITNYSKALSIKKTKNGEFFEMVLN